MRKKSQIKDLFQFSYIEMDAICVSKNRNNSFSLDQLILKQCIERHIVSEQ